MDSSGDDPERPDFGGIEPEGQDFRGSYGFGRPAHKPDPKAKYGFDPKNKLLPPRHQRDVKP